MTTTDAAPSGPEPDKGAGEVAVTRPLGRHTPPERTYVPLAADFLLPRRAPGFDVFQLVDSGTLQLFVPRGTEPSEALRAALASETELLHLYVRLSDKEALLRHIQDNLSGFLEDESVPIHRRCALVQRTTNLLSRELYDHPTAANIHRQRENVGHMVDFALREPGALRGLLALTTHDYYTYTHSVNVGLYALTIATEYFGRMVNTACGDLREIAAGFFLHDIGKTRVPSEIINKRGPLTDEEWVEIRQHPLHGHAILETEASLSPEVASIVLQHHEKLDGTGYPRQLADGAIDATGRICALADIFDALTTRRSYKEAIPPFTALAIMKKEVGTHLDPDLFAAFVRLMERKR